jgi:hypothetical protein
MNYCQKILLHKNKGVFSICLFVYGVFNDTVCNSDYILLNERCLMSKKLEKMWYEA